MSSTSILDSSSPPWVDCTNSCLFVQTFPVKIFVNIIRTWRLLTDWNRTNLNCMGLPPACSLVSSKIWAASGSTTSSTSSNPSEGRLIRNFTVFGALSISFDLRMIDLIRTAWLNWDMNFRVLTVMFYDRECPWHKLECSIATAHQHHWEDKIPSNF